MTTRALTIKIRTSLAWTDLMAGLELVADSADNITVDVMPVKRGYKKKGKPKPKRQPELEYERGPSHDHSGVGEQYDRISVDASLKKNNLRGEELMKTASARGSASANPVRSGPPGIRHNCSAGTRTFSARPPCPPLSDCFLVVLRLQNRWFFGVVDTTKV